MITTIKSSINIEMIAIDENGYHFMIQAFANGKTIRLLVDTGASRTVFDKSRLLSLFNKKEIKFKNVVHKSVGLGTKSMKSQTAVLSELRIGDIVLCDFQVVVLNLEHVNFSYQMIGDAGIDGVIGSDLLVDLNAIINIPKRELLLKQKRVQD